MTFDEFVSLHREQQWSMVLAQDVTNTLEEFLLGEALGPDSDLTELNRRIRHSLLMTVHTLMNAEKPGCQYGLDHRVLSIPEEWEVPALMPEEKELLDEGYNEANKEAYEQSDVRREEWFRTGSLDGA